MRLTYEDGNRALGFECFDTWLSRWVCDGILKGETYPRIPFVDDVRVVLDVGANCGAASCYFASCYPDAEIHAFEPATAPFQLLAANAANHRNVHVHHLGLHATDQTVPLYHGRVDTVTASVFQRDTNATASETVTLRAAGDWLDEHGIGRIDVLKVDVEGCEVPVLESLQRHLGSVKVLYVEYDSADARREIERLLSATHELCFGLLLLTQGELVYVAKDVLAANRDAEAVLFDMWRSRLFPGGGLP